MLLGGTSEKVSVQGACVAVAITVLVACAGVPVLVLVGGIIVDVAVGELQGTPGLSQRAAFTISVRSTPAVTVATHCGVEA